MIFTLDRNLSLPMHRQLYHRILESIADGRLRPGSRVPSMRALAAELNLARGTVEAAYQQLIAEGYLHAQGAAGTRVAPQLAIRSVHAPRHASPVEDYEAVHSGSLPLPLQMGLPALDAFARTTWSRLAARQLRQAGMEGLVYPEARGNIGLRGAIARYLGVSRGITCRPEQVFVCAGYRACLDLISRTLLADGDECWLEDPGYFIARQFLQQAGAKLIPVPVDEQGLRVESGIARAPAARFAVVTPTHQSPLGVSLSLARRLELLAWANRQGSWIIEDDYDSEYRYVGKPLPALKSLDAQGRVLYAGTFSKVLFPGLRLAYLVVPPEQVGAFARQADRLHNHCPNLLQETVACFMNEGHFARHLKKMRSLYARRRRYLIDALQAELGEHLVIDQQAGGMHLVARLHSGDDRAITRRARERGLAIEPLSAWYLDAPAGQGLVMSFTNVLSAEHATALMAQLGAAIAD